MTMVAAWYRPKRSSSCRNADDQTERTLRLQQVRLLRGLDRLGAQALAADVGAIAVQDERPVRQQSVGVNVLSIRRAPRFFARQPAQHQNARVGVQPLLAGQRPQPAGEQLEGPIGQRLRERQRLVGQRVGGQAHKPDLQQVVEPAISQAGLLLVNIDVVLEDVDDRLCQFAIR